MKHFYGSFPFWMPLLLLCTSFVLVLRERLCDINLIKIVCVWSSFMITVIREIGGCVFVCLGIFIDFHFNWFRFSLHFRFMNFSFHFSAEAIVVRAMLEFQHQQQRLHPLQRQGTPRQVYYYTILLLLPFFLSSYFPCMSLSARWNECHRSVHWRQLFTWNKNKNFDPNFSFSSISIYRRAEQSMFHLHVRIHWHPSKI